MSIRDRISELEGQIAILESKILVLEAENKQDFFGLTVDQMANALRFCEREGFDPKVHKLC